MLKIRLKRTGQKATPFFRIVLMENLSRRDGKSIAELGYYDPLKKVLKFNKTLLHKYINCDLPILTDSGGFQVMSLSKLNKIDKEKGAIFNSHVDGKKFYLSPEESIRIQLGLNADIVMIMDECPKKTTD